MSQGKRERLSFRPEFDPVISGWAVNHLRTNYWRVAGHYEFEDMIQEAWLVFATCRDSYPHVNEARHFTSLFKTAFRNRIHDLSYGCSNEKGVVADEGDDGLCYEEVLANIVGNTPNAGFATVLLNEIPKELKTLLNAMCDEAMRGVFHTPMERFDTGNGLSRRQTTNQYWCGLLGFDSDRVDLVGMLLSYFGS